MNTALAVLEEADTDLVCVDVGSAAGFHPRFREVKSRARLIGFEPDPDECSRLTRTAEPGERYINAALGRSGEQVSFHLHRKRNTSSVYDTDRVRLSHFDDATRLDVERVQLLRTRSLDEVGRSEGILPIDYLKVDVEGHELSVLEGYSGRLLMAEIEVTFHPFRIGVPLFDEVMRHMRQRGLFLLDLRRTYWSPGERREIRNHPTKGMLMFGDALFALDPHLEMNGHWLDTTSDRAKYLALLCLYGYPAEALMCLDVFRASRQVDDGELERIRASITRFARSRKWAQPRVARLLLLLERWFSLPIAVSEGLFLNDGAQTDGELGNWDMLKHLNSKPRSHEALTSPRR
jgi:FkbM family methyltransferase